MARDPEVYKRINANLQYVYSGQARRDAEKAAQAKRERKAQDKIDARRKKALVKRIAALREELTQLDEFFADIEADRADIGLPTVDGKVDPAYRQGTLEEVDCAREGCLHELLDCETELTALG